MYPGNKCRGDSIFESRRVNVLNETQDGTYRIKNEPRFGLMQKIVVVGKSLVVPNMIELIKYTN